ncbi:MAG: hypothetical protein ACRDXB_10185, partial [Actinomycetes bacterium]
AGPPPAAASQPARPTEPGSLLGRVPVGRGPQGVVVSPDGTRAYTANYQDITVIDIAAGTATATIGLNSIETLALSPDGSRLYVPMLSGFLSIVDTATNTQVAAVPIPDWPTSATVAPDGRSVYIAHNDSTSKEVFLTVVDTASSAVVATVPVIPPDPARQAAGTAFLAVAPDSATVWVASNDSVTVVDPAAHTVVATIPVPRSENISIAGDRAYVFRGLEGITVIDTAARTKLGDIPLGGVTQAMTVAPDARYLYVASRDTAPDQPATIQVIDTTTSSLVHEITVGEQPTVPVGLAVAPDGRTLFLAATAADAALVVDTSPYV